MSILIDNLFRSSVQEFNQNINGKWYIAKSIDYFQFSRIKDAIRILTGKSRAYHYKEDECVGKSN